jgi:hypothetical protein
MSLTTDEIDAVRAELSEATYSTVYDTAQIDHLVVAIGQLTRLVEKLHARILFLEQQQQRQENY